VVALLFSGKKLGAALGRVSQDAQHGAQSALIDGADEALQFAKLCLSQHRPRSGRCSPIGFIVAQNEAGEL